MYFISYLVVPLLVCLQKATEACLVLFTKGVSRPCSVYKRLRCVFTNGVMEHCTPCIDPSLQMSTMALYSGHFINFIGVFTNGYYGIVFHGVYKGVPNVCNGVIGLCILYIYPYYGDV